jgi:hypothetical protein
VQIDRWVNATTVILRVENKTDRLVSVRGAFGERELESSTGVTSSGEPTYERGILPNQDLQVFVCNVMVLQEFELEIVPWTHGQMLRAEARCRNWPQPVQDFLMVKYRPRAEHRHRVSLPNYADTSEVLP